MKRELVYKAEVREQNCQKSEMTDGKAVLKAIMALELIKTEVFCFRLLLLQMEEGASLLCSKSCPQTYQSDRGLQMGKAVFHL